MVKVVEPPPGPPVLATLLAEIYGPDPETRRATAAKVREAFASVPFVVDVDDSFGQQMPRVRVLLEQDQVEFNGVEQRDVYDTLRTLQGGTTVGYSHRGGGRQPIPIRLELSKANRVVDERMLSTPVPANALPGNRGVVELGDVVSITREPSSFPIFRHNGRPAELVTAELAGAFEAPIYGMLAVGEAIDKLDWGNLAKPAIALHGQPLDESRPTLLWDGEWEVTWVTFRDMGGAFLIALVGIYILVVAQFGSFKLPLVILTTDDGPADHVTERYPGDLPLAIPQQRRSAFVQGLSVQRDRRLGEVAPVPLVDCFTDRKHAVDRGFVGAGQLGCDQSAARPL